MKNESKWKKTENGADAYNTTGNDVLDFFTTLGTSRKADESEIHNRAMASYLTDPLLTLKALFYGRDVRGGLGERKVFTSVLRSFADYDPATIIANLHNVVEFGRWTDLFCLIGSPVEDAVVNYITQQLKIDSESVNISLLAKWLPKTNRKQGWKRYIAKRVAKAMGLPYGEYNFLLVTLRQKLKVVELDMSAKQWDRIDYSGVPSIAIKNYKDSFYRRDGERFAEYIESVQKGEKKINASTLYPYDILKKGASSCSKYDPWSYTSPDAVVEALWKAQKNYIEGENNILVMVDTSGSMGGDPMFTSTSLGIYFAERNKGAFKNKIMTFSSRPFLVELKGDTLCSKLQCIPEITDSTNLYKAFKLVLNTCIKNNTPAEEVPTLLVVSDMQIDSCQVGGAREAFSDKMRGEFEAAGYKMPNLIFCNVSSNYKPTYLGDGMTKGVTLLSGSSGAVFKDLLKDLSGMTAYDLMIEILSNPRYDVVEYVG